MKNFIFSKSLFLMALSMGLLFFNSCSKEEVSTPDIDTDTFDQEFGKFTKEITISDESGENTAILRIGSDDQSILNMCQPENYRLIPILEGQNPEEVMGTINSTTEEENLQEADASDLVTEEANHLVAGKISTMIISKNLKPGVKSIALTSISTYTEDLRGWGYETYYSSPGQNPVKCTFFGYNLWKRGYYSLEYKSSSSSTSWSNIISPWKRIKINESHSYYKIPCYQMKARKKYDSNSVTIMFEYE